MIDELIKVTETSKKLLFLTEEEINQLLLYLANELTSSCKEILAANTLDLEKIDHNDPIYDRVLLNEKRIDSLAESIKEICNLPSPIGEKIEEKTLNNGLLLQKISVPMGVIGVIFEARPNVVIDIFALCLKSRNACVLKGGSQSEKTNEVLVKIIQKVLKNLKDVVYLLPNERELVNEVLKARDYIDLIIPRGGKGLIDFVRENSLVPVIETGAGVVHIYVDESADLSKAKDIVFNAKISRPSVCNAIDTLIVHKSRLEDLNRICIGMAEKGVEIYADDRAFSSLIQKYPSSLLHKEEKFGEEFLSLKMSVKVVDNLSEAISHINKFGSKHSESIITENEENADRFLKEVDAACVYVNASTRFTDGWVFGLGAEVGISTQKLHARGPMGIKELTTYKWMCYGNGQIRT